MTIDEAIEHAKELARTSEDNQSAAKYIQLTEWLRQARGADKAARWCTEKIRKLEAENSMLRERLLESRESNERIKRLEQENAKLREFAADACTVLRNHYDKDWFDGTIFAERMRELGIEVDE